MLVRFISSHSDDNQDFIKGVQHENPTQVLQLIKEVGSIKIDGEDYRYVDSIFSPTFDDVCIDVLNIVVDYINYSDN